MARTRKVVTRVEAGGAVGMVHGDRAPTPRDVEAMRGIVGAAAKLLEGAGPGTRGVEERLVEGARAFVTIGPDAFVWMVLEAQHLPKNIAGSFVRLEPREVSTDEEVARVRRLCEEGGALKVVVLPRRKGATVLAPRERRPHRKARDVVAELVVEANVREEDRPALAEFVETILSRRGL